MPASTISPSTPSSTASCSTTLCGAMRARSCGVVPAERAKLPRPGARERVALEGVDALREDRAAVRGDVRERRVEDLVARRRHRQRGEQHERGEPREPGDRASAPDDAREHDEPDVEREQARLRVAEREPCEDHSAREHQQQRTRALRREQQRADEREDREGLEAPEQARVEEQRVDAIEARVGVVHLELAVREEVVRVPLVDGDERQQQAERDLEAGEALGHTRSSPNAPTSAASAPNGSATSMTPNAPLSRFDVQNSEADASRVQAASAGARAGRAPGAGRAPARARRRARRGRRRGTRRAAAGGPRAREDRATAGAARDHTAGTTSQGQRSAIAPPRRGLRAARRRAAARATGAPAGGPRAMAARAGRAARGRRRAARARPDAAPGDARRAAPPLRRRRSQRRMAAALERSLARDHMARRRRGVPPWASIGAPPPGPLTRKEVDEVRALRSVSLPRRARSGLRLRDGHGPTTASVQPTRARQVPVSGSTSTHRGWRSPPSRERRWRRITTVPVADNAADTGCPASTNTFEPGAATASGAIQPGFNRYPAGARLTATQDGTSVTFALPYGAFSAGTTRLRALPNPAALTGGVVAPAAAGSFTGAAATDGDPVTATEPSRTPPERRSRSPSGSRRRSTTSRSTPPRASRW